ncbi:alpha-L-fucosidase [Ruania halotolerans]|uniref:alpha-L-fucosidase n=1 Tax=Ruania halotolerans TaxID=2897773 RepID=UPI001E4C0836|nr:alpha-L-fucosidase [Ruania halotolerans]UFU07194.1 alpha-L-fucosidase [Ruania halotolerans]
MTLAQTDWFTAARFGLFVHFGLYSVAARHEWVMTREQIPLNEYERYAQVFDPDRFDARAIARAARSAGMGYAVLTTKHHDGFALWNSGVSDYTSMQACGRDLVAEFAEACRAEGLRVGFYHSVIDWHHPDFTIDCHHPRREDGDLTELNSGRDMARYREYLHAQVRELLTGYGPVDYLFYDFTYPDGMNGLPGKGAQDWDAEALLALTRELQPGIIVNDRLGIGGDLVTPEQYQPDGPMTSGGVPVLWEACQTMNGSWGYDRDNLEFKSADLLVRMLVDSVAKGGNLLLNVGPDGRGALTPQDSATLAEIGTWMDLHAQSVIGAGPSEVPPPPGTALTRRDDRLYLHLLTWAFGHVHLPGLAGKVRFARFLHDGSEVARTEFDPGQQAWNTTPGGQPPGTLTLQLPTIRPDVLHPVIEIILDGEN